MFFEFIVPVILNYHSREYGDYFWVYYPEQKIHYIYINNTLYIESTPTCFDASALSSDSLNLVLWSSYKLIKITTQN
jgi:hypothetical protein